MSNNKDDEIKENENITMEITEKSLNDIDAKKRTDEISCIHHSFKAANGYSKLEISSKRDSLEGVLVTETESQHLDRAKELGFKSSTKLMSNLNFSTYMFQK